MKAASPRDEELQELLAEVRRIEVQSRRLVNDLLAGGYTSVFRGSGLEFESVREYVEGDDARMVDWNVTAREGRPFVKTYVDERELTVVFLLDLSASMTGGFAPWSARQIAARVCGCLALSAIRNDDKVGLIAFSDGVDAFVPPTKGAGHGLRIVRDCLAMTGSSPRSDLTSALDYASRVVKRHAVVFVVSDFLVPSGWENAMLRCARRHDVIAVRLLTPELSPRATDGMMRVRDPETGVESVVDWRSDRVRAAFTERVEAWDRRTIAALRRASVDRMDIEIPREQVKDVVAAPILRFFRMRELRGEKR